MKKFLLPILLIITANSFAGIKVENVSHPLNDVTMIETNFFKMGGFFSTYVSYAEYSDKSETFYLHITYTGSHVYGIKEGDELIFTLTDGSYITLTNIRSSDGYSSINYASTPGFYHSGAVTGIYEISRENIQRLSKGADKMKVYLNSAYGKWVEYKLNSSKIEKQITKCIEVIDSAKM